ncbi:MAG: cytochrome c biogenesis protein CcsA [Terracidiphilus sp.]
MKKLAIGLYALVTVALLGWAYYQAIYVAPTTPRRARCSASSTTHVPSATVAFLFFAVSLIGSIGYLANRHSHLDRAQMFDAWALAGAEVGVVFCSVVLITRAHVGQARLGYLVDLGDARLVTTLLLWLIYVSYLLLRRFAAGPQMQTLASVLGIFGAIDVPIVYMSNRWFRTQHPAPVFGGGQDSGMDSSMVGALLWNMLAWFLWGVLILVLRYRVERKQQKITAEEAEQALKW